MSEKGIANYFRFFSRGSQNGSGVLSENALSAQLMNLVESLIIILNKEGEIVEFNPACERLTGYTKREVLGRPFDFLIPRERAKEVRDAFQGIVSGRTIASYQSHWLTKDGRKLPLVWSSTCVKNEDSSIKYVVATGMDVSEIRLWEKRHVLMIEILATLSQVDNEDQMFNRILHLLRDYAGCDAAGLRLRKGDDYPYAQTIGFSDQFVKEETMLCSLQGAAPGNEDGTGTLECMCGRVISGDLTEGLAPITGQGAFFTGNINELATALARKKLPFTIRNHCGQAGYSSIALIPLRFHDQTVGLLQLNDKEIGKFKDDDVEFLSGAGHSIGAALVRFQAEDARRTSERILNALVEKARDGYSIHTPDGKTIMYNQAMVKISGYSEEEVNRHGWFYLVFPNEEDRRQAVQKARLVMAGKLDYVEAKITCKSGERKNIAFSLSPLQIEDKTYNLATMIDLSHKVYHV
jgi:PAS domain S-box-containing protein